MQNLHASVCTMSLPQQLAGLFSVALTPARSFPCVCLCVCPGVSTAVCPASPGYPFFSSSSCCVVLFALRSSMKIIGPMSFVQQCVKSSLYNQVFLSSFLFLFVSLLYSPYACTNCRLAARICDCETFPSSVDDVCVCGCVFILYSFAVYLLLADCCQP